MTTERKVLIGEAIKKYRKQNALTLEQLSVITGLSNPYLSQIETGKKNGTIITALTLAETFGVTLDELVKGNAGDSK